MLRDKEIIIPITYALKISLGFPMSRRIKSTAWILISSAVLLLLGYVYVPLRPFGLVGICFFWVGSLLWLSLLPRTRFRWGLFFSLFLLTASGLCVFLLERFPSEVPVYAAPLGIGAFTLLLLLLYLLFRFLPAPQSYDIRFLGWMTGLGLADPLLFLLVVCCVISRL